MFSLCDKRDLLLFSRSEMRNPDVKFMNNNQFHKDIEKQLHQKQSSSCFNDVFLFGISLKK